MSHLSSIFKLANYFNYQLFSYAGVEDDKKYLIERYPDQQADVSSLSPKYIKWLSLRFGENPTIQEIHPLPDCLPTIKKYQTKEAGLSQKYNSNPEFKSIIDESFPIDSRGWQNPSDAIKISSDQMERIISIAARPPKRKTVEGLEQGKASYSLPEEDRIGKVGGWDLWLPTSRENSCKIARYNPENMEPDTTWCTARTTGSNLFYNYIGGTSGKCILFYVIKENPNPTVDADYLSIGFVNGQVRLNGERGGLSVDRDNNGLTPEILESILGSNYNPIIKILQEKTNSLNGFSPAYSKIEEASKDINKFKSLIRGNTEEEANLIIDNIVFDYNLAQNLNDDLIQEIVKINTIGRLLLFCRSENKKLALLATSKIKNIKKEALEAAAKSLDDFNNFCANYKESFYLFKHVLNNGASEEIMQIMVTKTRSAEMLIDIARRAKKLQTLKIILDQENVAWEGDHQIKDLYVAIINNECVDKEVLKKIINNIKTPIQDLFIYFINNKLVDQELLRLLIEKASIGQIASILSNSAYDDSLSNVFNEKIKQILSDINVDDNFSFPNIIPIIDFIFDIIRNDAKVDDEVKKNIFNKVKQIFSKEEASSTNTDAPLELNYAIIFRFKYASPTISNPLIMEFKKDLILLANSNIKKIIEVLIEDQSFRSITKLSSIARKLDDLDTLKLIIRKTNSSSLISNVLNNPRITSDLVDMIIEKLSFTPIMDPTQDEDAQRANYYFGLDVLEDAKFKKIQLKEKEANHIINYIYKKANNFLLLANKKLY